MRHQCHDRNSRYYRVETPTLLTAFKLRDRVTPRRKHTASPRSSVSRRRRGRQLSALAPSELARGRHSCWNDPAHKLKLISSTQHLPVSIEPFLSLCLFRPFFCLYTAFFSFLPSRTGSAFLDSRSSHRQRVLRPSFVTNSPSPCRLPPTRQLVDGGIPLLLTFPPRLRARLRRTDTARAHLTHHRHRAHPCHSLRSRFAAECPL